MKRRSPSRRFGLVTLEHLNTSVNPRLLPLPSTLARRPRSATWPKVLQLTISRICSSRLLSERDEKVWPFGSLPVFRMSVSVSAAWSEVRPWFCEENARECDSVTRGGEIVEIGWIHEEDPNVQIASMFCSVRLGSSPLVGGCH